MTLVIKKKLLWGSDNPFFFFSFSSLSFSQFPPVLLLSLLPFFFFFFFIFPFLVVGLHWAWGVESGWTFCFFLSSSTSFLFFFFCLDPVDPIPFRFLLFPSLLNLSWALLGLFSLSSLYFILGRHMT